MAKKRPCLPKQKISRQKSKMLLRTGGELEDMMLGSVQEKMRKGVETERVVDGTKETLKTARRFDYTIDSENDLVIEKTV